MGKLDGAIAIVGMGGVFPGAADPEAFWRVVCENRDRAEEPPPARWSLDVDEVYDARAGMPDKVYSRRACFVDAAALALDYDILDVDAAQVARLDPLHTLLLYAGQEAFRDAALHEYDRSRMGLIAGNLALPTESASKWSWQVLGRTFEEKVIGESLDCDETDPLNRYVTGLPAGVAAKALGLGLGGHTLDAACASSLYAIKLAMDELLAGRADAMLAGGVSRPDSLYTQMGFSQLRALSPKGIPRPFDAQADGLVVGEGAGIFVLKRATDAVRDGDTIHGLIRGAGVSNDVGGRLLAPTTEGQLRAMRAAYDAAGWAPESVGLIECHATGTPVGDAVEFESLGQLWAGAKRGGAVIGSVKSNIGHLLTAAGAAALMKVLLALRHKELPPSANFETTPEGVDLEGSPFRILSGAEQWQATEGHPRRAAVSAFGFGGINAHVLVEAWEGEAAAPEGPAIEIGDAPVAVIGMDAHFGAWEGLRAFQERVLGGGEDAERGTSRNWWGVGASAWYRRAGHGREDFAGHYLDDAPVRLDAFRIPPKELEEMLPQQVLALQTAARAWADAGLDDGGDTRAGVFLGLGLDLNTTNFHVRWMLQEKARLWARHLDLRLDEESREAWCAELRDAFGPPLTANRTMGALASVAASRIARELRLGGPSFTVSAEELSGIQALRVAVRSLQNRTVDKALVGAVDLHGDVRSVLGAQAAGALDAAVGEGAAAVVLKRLDDALRDGDRIYGVVEGIGTSQDCMKDAVATAKGTDDARVDYVELAEGCDARALTTPGRELAVGGVAEAVGATGAAADLAGLVKACSCLYQELLPSARGLAAQGPGVFAPQSPEAWLRDRETGPRRAAVLGRSVDGAHGCVLLRGHDEDTSANDVSLRQPLGARSEALFCLFGDTPGQLEAEAERLRAYCAEHARMGLEGLARGWWRRTRDRRERPLALSCVARNASELLEQLAFARNALENAPEKRLDGATGLDAIARDRVFYNPKPLCQQGKIAFVFPGSGNQFAEMGRELFVQWPEVLRTQDGENGRLRSQMQPEYFWNVAARGGRTPTHKAFIFGQVALGTAVSDLMRRFGVAPEACIGYSLGETAGLFSLRAWRARDEMLDRIGASDLFTNVLAGDCDAARKTWQLPKHEAVDWVLGVIDRPMQVAKAALKNRKKVYPLIANTLQESVIGGNRKAVEHLIKNLQCSFIPLEGVTTVHCEVVKEVEKEYRDLHLFETTPPKGVRFYSGAWGRSYPVSRESAADSVTAQAVEGVDFPRVIEGAYEDGARCFVELGPGNSCSRMIGRILGTKPHVARSVCHDGQDAVSLVLRGLAQLTAEGAPVDLDVLYGQPTRVAGHQVRSEKEAPALRVPVGGAPFRAPAPPSEETPTVEAEQSKSGTTEAHAYEETPDAVQGDYATVASALVAAETARASAHQTFLALSADLTRAMTEEAAFQSELTARLHEAGAIEAAYGAAWQGVVEAPAHVPSNGGAKPFLDRAQCLEFGVGKIGDVLGPEFAPVDAYPTRVRLPDEPLMLVDRIVLVEGEARSMSSGRVVTEHDVLHDGWYLDGGRIPTCITVEAGQADLFLSGYLGIDFETKGIACYRLLDAQVTFHGELPKPGEVIRYDIRIKRFFRHGNPWFFHFEFESTVDGRPLLSMENGCAGFFTPEELDAGQGVVTASVDAAPQPGKRPADWRTLAPMAEAAYDAAKLDALRQGDLAGCFGDDFARLGLDAPLTIPGGRMQLVHRVTDVEPEGGRFGLGFIRAEADIHPDDWFITCHFVDDKVMPGTLMYECCLHTFRVFLMRMGWAGEAADCVWQPVPGVVSVLKCRGQVLETTKLVTYEVTVKELGYGPEPYAIGDARMYADGKAIVDINHMSVRLSGQTRAGVEALWAAARAPKRILYDAASILAFTEGNPSEAFGDRYKPFDNERRIARLPRAPYCFLDRIVEVTGEKWKMRAGGGAEAEYDVPPDAWYFDAERLEVMPFAVLLEVALQVCGWYSSYMGSALLSEDDLKYRNLGGKAVQYKAVGRDVGTLTTRVKVTNVAHSGDMIIQHFEMETRDRSELVYKGTTYFGFFTKAALAEQKGVQEAKRYVPDAAELARAESIAYPVDAPFPDTMLRMVEQVTCFVPDGGPNGLGFIRGTKKVDPSEWFFEAHFYQDPVNPGSLGLEAFLQLLKLAAARRWGADEETRFEPMALGESHEWIYRGQVLPSNKEVTVEAVITAVDDTRRVLRAEGYLIVDGLVIYQMKEFCVRLVEGIG